MDNLMEKKLESLREFQVKYPTSHVGGSIGLMLRGFNLGRDLTYSDFDIIIKEHFPNRKLGFKYRSSTDFDYTYNIFHSAVPGNTFFTKCDIKIDNKQTFDLISYNEKLYRVSKIEEILEYKLKYALKGNFKHKEDLINVLNQLDKLIDMFPEF